MAYSHLDTDMQSQIEKGTRVYHVTKEFGPATLTDIGKQVTAMAAAQQKSNMTEVAIVMPFYTFMRRLNIEKEIDMMVEIRGKRTSQIQNVEFRVWKMMHAFNPPLQPPNKYEYQMIDGVNTSVMITPQRPTPPEDAVPVYMIGHGNKRPFNQAYKCRLVEQIYDENDLPNEWRDQYFAKAAAAFLAHKATATDEESIFAPIRIVPRVDIVHLHGASNAYVAKHLHDKRVAEDLGPRPPAIVYTMYNDDQDIHYANAFRNVKKFLDHMVEREELQKYVHGQRMYMSRLAIDRAEVVTVAGRTLAKDIVEGRNDFHLKELVMDSLLKKVENARFFGIHHGVDYHSSEHPFMSDKLVHRNFAFPPYAFHAIQNQPSLFAEETGYLGQNVLQDTTWRLSENVNDFVITLKDRAKRYLVKRSLFTDADIKRPMVLFRGTLEKGTGVEMLAEAATYFVKHNIRFVILAKTGNYPAEEIKQLQARHPHHINVLLTPKDERKYGIFLRSAADLVFVPNSQGYEAAEGMVFGAPVISPGTGPLSGLFIDRPTSKYSMRRQVDVTFATPNVKSEKGALVTSSEYYNSYLYNSTETLELAIRDASNDHRTLRKDKALKEEYVLRMVRSALTLAWDRGHYQGPVHEYNQIYEMALQDRPIPEMRRHEVEQEQSLVSRLQDDDIIYEE
jgi:glycogen synthase